MGSVREQIEIAAGTPALAKVTYGVAGLSVYLGLTAEAWAALIAASAAIVTAVVNWWYRRAHYKLAERRAEAIERRHAHDDDPTADEGDDA